MMQPRWAKPILRWGFGGPAPIPASLFPIWMIFALGDAAESWQAVCGMIIQMELETQDLDIVVRWGHINHGLAAVADLPGHDHVGQLNLTLSQDVDWSRLDVQAVCAHEWGHLLGLSHGPAGSLMFGEYRAGVREPQTWDIAEAVARYGKPKGGRDG